VSPGDIVEVLGIFLSTPNDHMTSSTYGLVHQTFIEASDLIKQKDYNHHYEENTNLYQHVLSLPFG